MFERLHPLAHFPYPRPPQISLLPEARLLTADYEAAPTPRPSPWRRELHQRFFSSSSPRNLPPCPLFTREDPLFAGGVGKLREWLRGSRVASTSVDPQADKNLFGIGYAIGAIGVLESQPDLREGLRVQLEAALVPLFLAELMSEFVSGEASIAMFEPLGSQPPGDILPYPRISCFNFMLQLFLPGSELLGSGLSPFGFRYWGTHLLEMTVAAHFHHLPSSEPARVNDLVLYSKDREAVREDGPTHVARVVAVQEEEVWVESKLGMRRRPCLHRIGEVPTSEYGTNYDLFRVKEENPPGPRSTQTFSEAGYRIPTRPAWAPDVLPAAAMRLSHLAFAEGAKTFFQYL